METSKNFSGTLIIILIVVGFLAYKGPAFFLKKSPSLDTRSAPTVSSSPGVVSDAGQVIAPSPIPVNPLDSEENLLAKKKSEDECNSGMRDSCNWVAEYFRAKNQPEASAMFYRKACKKSILRMMECMAAGEYLKGIEVTRAVANCEAGDASECLMVAAKYLKSPNDQAEGKKYFALACFKGFNEACSRIVAFLTPDDVKAYSNSCEVKKNLRACLIVGEALKAQKDFSGASAIFLKTCKAREMWACNLLGQAMSDSEIQKYKRSCDTSSELLSCGVAIGGELKNGRFGNLRPLLEKICKGGYQVGCDIIKEGLPAF